jgi:hypothetical protein
VEEWVAVLQSGELVQWIEKTRLKLSHSRLLLRGKQEGDIYRFDNIVTIPKAIL